MLLLQNDTIKTPDGSLIHGLSELFDKLGVIQVIGIFGVGLTIYLLYRIIYAWAVSKFSDTSKEKDNKIEELTKMLAKSTKKDVVSTQQYIGSDSLTNLKQHPFFDNLNIWLEIRLGQMKIEPAAKYNIFKDFLYIKLSVMKNNWVNFINSHDLVNMSREELKSSLTNLLITINNETIDKVDSAGFPDVILKELNDSSVLADKLISTAIEGFISNDHFEDGYDALYAILQVNMSVLEVIVYDLAGIMSGLNGSLDHIEYDIQFYKK